MNADDKKQKISALADGDLSGTGSWQTIKHLTEDSELRGVWERYHLIGDAIRGEATRFAGRSVAQEVSRRLSAEPTVLVPDRGHRLRRAVYWARPAAGGALAAGVAILAVLAVPRFLGLERPIQGSVAVNLSGAQGGVFSGGWRHVDPLVEAKLNRFLVDHGEYVTPASVPRVLPYVSLVSYDATR